MPGNGRVQPLLQPQLPESYGPAAVQAPITPVNVVVPRLLNRNIPEIRLDQACFEFLEKLGAGESGASRKATFYTFPVALKTLPHHENTSTGELSKDIELLASIKHPNIVTWRGVVLDENFLPVYLMTDFEQTNLRQRLEGSTGKLMYLREIILIGGGIADGLSHLHSHCNIAHRDIKPENVLLRGEPCVAKLCNFGVSCRKPKCAPLYCAPEKLTRGDACGPPSDIFCLGMVLLEMAINETPFSSDSKDRNMGSKEREVFINKVPYLGLRDLIVTCLAEVPSERPTAEIVRDKLKGMFTGKCRNCKKRCGYKGTQCPYPRC